MADVGMEATAPLFDEDMSEMTEAEVLGMITEMTVDGVDDGLGLSYGVEILQAGTEGRLDIVMVRDMLHRIFREMDLDEDYIMSKSTDVEVATAVQKYFSDVGYAIRKQIMYR